MILVLGRERQMDYLVYHESSRTARIIQRNTVSKETKQKPKALVTLRLGLQRQKYFLYFLPKEIKAKWRVGGGLRTEEEMNNC